MTKPCASFFFSEGACYGLWQQAGCVFFSVGEGKGQDHYMGSMMHRAEFGPRRVQESPKNKIQVKRCIGKKLANISPIIFVGTFVKPRCLNKIKALEASS